MCARPYCRRVGGEVEGEGHLFTLFFQRRPSTLNTYLAQESVLVVWDSQLGGLVFFTEHYRACMEIFLHYFFEETQTFTGLLVRWRFRHPPQSGKEAAKEEEEGDDEAINAASITSCDTSIGRHTPPFPVKAQEHKKKDQKSFFMHGL